MSRIVFIFLLLLAGAFQSLADIRSTSGNISFDVNSDGTNEVVLSDTGLGLGTSTASANLHLMGNAIMSEFVYVGTNAGNSNLEVNGSLGFGIESVSANTTLSGNSVIIANTNSDNILLTLPYAGNVSGRSYLIKKSDSSNKLWVAGGGNSIDDIGTVEMTSISTGLPHLGVISNGAQWLIHSLSGGINTIGSDNLVGWWKLDETSGTAVIDSSGQSNSGNLLNGFDFSTNGITGKINRALDFDGDDDQIRLGKKAATDVGSSYTVSAWVNTRDPMTSARMAVYSTRMTDDAGAWQIEIGRLNSQNRSVGMTGLSNWTAVSVADVLSSNAWYHIVGVKDGTGASNTRIFVNGTEVSYNIQSAYTPIDSIDDPLIGDGTLQNTKFNGHIDDVRLYNRPLTEIEIQALYQQGE